jgi:hypothetical protein
MFPLNENSLLCWLGARRRWLKYNVKEVIFQILSATIMKVTAFLDIVSCSLVETYWCFRYSYYFHSLIALMIGPISFSETSACSYQHKQLKPQQAVILNIKVCRCPSTLTSTWRWVFLSRRPFYSQKISTSSPVVCDGMPSASVAIFVG